ncbi:MAG: hypothetical protein IRZ09_13035 [Variibacter sp.]|nr:hypothetical protein [Variibacter sp.]
MSRPRTCDHEAVLDLWCAGLTLREIAAAVGARVGTVTGVIIRARRRGDPRALRRYHPELYRPRMDLRAVSPPAPQPEFTLEAAE